LLREWLRRCDESHRCDERSVNTKAFLPTRLLYVGNTNDPDSLRLDPTTGISGAKYIALSHRWGDLRDDEKKNFCTTKDNIDQRLSGFNISDLPKTFQDAIKVTRELKVSYLWIDSLCIIQSGDDGKDWKSESNYMLRVYSSAYCTIAATSARNMKDGFLDHKVSPEYLYVRDNSGRRFYICAGNGDFEVDVDKAELNTRAWVMQERVLSRRTVHFSANQMYWECGQGVYCEDLTEMKSSLRKTYFMLDSNFPARLLGSGSRRTVEFISFLFEDYSKRLLTEGTDRAVAISGLQDRIAGALNCETRYGVFQRYLHRNLLWHACDNRLERIEYPKPEVPSWSWMAYTGGVKFMKIP
ncbi:heterokaryon incompatibility protein-domain-containing protein, partial [Phaeosphaeriaceae sp. PMI808]